MKNKSKVSTIILLFSLILSFLNFNLTAQSADDKMPEGIWFGTLVIPNTAELRMAVTISKKEDGKLDAALRIIDQNTGDIPCDVVSYKQDSILLKISHLGIEIEGIKDNENDIIKSEFRQRGGRFPLELKRVDKMPELNRPQEPDKPYPYIEEEVEYKNIKAGIKLAATLTLPKSDKSLPAVLLITGSGKQNRNEEGFGHKPFLVLADFLTRRGIAVLRADDRGVGASGGDFDKSTSADFATDAIAGVEYLKNRKEIDAKKIGLIGHSEGGLVAQIAADQSSDIAFIVTMAGPGISFDEMVTYQVLEQLKLEGISKEDLELQRSWRKEIYGLFKQNLDSATIADKMIELHSALSEEKIKRLNWPRGRLNFEIKRSLSPWWHFALSYDPAATLKRLKCPVLAINGDKDKQNPSEKNLSAIKKALNEGVSKNFLIKELAGLNHMFQTAETGSEYEYGRIEETISPVALKLIANWILEQVE